MKKTVRKTESGYPLMRYLSLLLVVALLFSGVTFARYALERNGSVNTGVALFDASYTVEGVNSLTFGNQSYWQTLAGGWYAQGGSRTVRIGMKNNSDIEVRANVLHMEGPAEFWENIALQLTTVKKEIESETGYAAGEVVTTQYVLADFLRKRGDGKYSDESATSGEMHNFTYEEGYIDWDTQKDANDAKDRVFDTDFSDEFGQRGGIEETFQMSGGIKTKDESGNETFSGSVTAVRTSATDTATKTEDSPGTPFFGSGTDDFQDLTITITASMQEVQYSVGFVRREGTHSMPAFYLDCVKQVPYYTIEITLPDNYTVSDESDPYFVLGAKTAQGEKGEEDSLLLFLTWTNSIPSSDLGTEAAPTSEQLVQIANGGEELADGTSVIGEYNSATVIGYHFNYNGVPATQSGQSIETTVRMNKKVLERNEDGGWEKLERPTITWEHIASINSGEGAYPHPLIAQTDKSYRCDRENYVEIAADVLGSEKYDGSFSSSEFETTTVDDKNVCVAAEKGYAVRFGVDFVQHSELPEQTGA